MKLGIFHRSHAATAKKCTKKRDAHANLFFCLIILAVLTFLLPLPLLMLKLPIDFQAIGSTAQHTI